jgi:hypothetical protein
MPELWRGTKVKHFKWLILLTLLLCSCGDKPSWLQAYDEFIERNKDNPLLYMEGSINECVNPKDYEPNGMLFLRETDIKNYGVYDYWAMPEESDYGWAFLGDCEDYAIFMYAKLIEHDIPSQLVIVDTKPIGDGRYHMYLNACGVYIDMWHTLADIDNIIAISNGALVDGWDYPKTW